MREKRDFYHRSNSDINKDSLKKSIAKLETPKEAERLIKLLTSDEKEKK